MRLQHTSQLGCRGKKNPRAAVKCILLWHDRFCSGSHKWREYRFAGGDCFDKLLEPRHLSSILDADTGTVWQTPKPNLSLIRQNRLQCLYNINCSHLLPSAIDPALMDSQSQPGVYLPNPYQTYTPPDLTYAQSYERYNSRTSSPGSLAQHSTAARVRAAPRRHLRQNLHFDIHQHKISIFLHRVMTLQAKMKALVQRSVSWIGLRSVSDTTIPIGVIVVQ